MDIELGMRLHNESPTQSEDDPRARQPDPDRRVDRHPQRRGNGHDDARIPAPLLLSATRAAGLFQRSALGHLNHPNWHDRLQSDGQRLIDLLVEMGFTPGSTRPGNPRHRRQSN